MKKKKVNKKIMAKMYKLLAFNEFKKIEQELYYGKPKFPEDRITKTW